MTTPRRFESISGILTRTADETRLDDANPPPAAGRAAAAEPAPVTRAARPATTPPTRSRRLGAADPAPRQQPASATADGGVRRIAFRLDPDLYTALNHRAARDGSSHGQIVLDSIEAAHTRGVLADIISRRAESADHGGLFPRLKTRGHSRPTVPVEIRLHTRAAAVLDTLVQQTNADSRTQLITAALHHHLG